jgi:hypothetical protein
MNSTVVSAYYHMRAKHSTDEYIRWLNNFLGSIDCNLIFFCEENMLSILKNMRKKYLHRTLFITLSKTEWVAYSKFDLNFWQEQNKVDREQNIHNYELYTVWYEKKEFVKRAIQINHFNTETFIWCDAGAFRNEYVLNDLKYFGNDNSNIPKDKVVLLLIEQYTNEDIEEIKKDPLCKNFDNFDRIGAGIQGAYIETWNKWIELYDKKVDERIKNKMFIGKEQTIMSIIALENPEIVQLIQPRYDIYDCWFTLLYYFTLQTIPLISILIPIYNGIEFIEESVSSVLEQSYEYWELIIGINGHPKDSDVYLIAKEYEKRSVKIKVFDFYTIKGKSTVLNEMIKYCNYEYVAILDVDDIWHKEKLKIQSPYFGIYDVIGSRCVYFGDKEGIVPYIPIGDISNFDFLRVNPVINSSSIIRKNICFWDKNHDGVEDYDLWLKLWRGGKLFYNCGEILIKHRIHKTSAFNNTNNNLVPELINKYSI